MSSFKLKVLLVGAGAVGKTSLVWRFIKNRFQANYKLTVGVDILDKEVEFRQGEIANLSIWDIGGQQRFDFIRDTFYKGTAGALLVFDLTRERTFEEVKKLLSEIRQFAGIETPFALIGNKADLMEDVGMVIDRDEARSFAENEGSIYIETSAKTGVNVENAFIELTRRIIYSREESYDKESVQKESEVIKKDIKGESYDKESVQKESERLDFLVEYKDLINSRVREILRSSKEEDFRFLIVGNEELQILLILKLLSVEGVVWPPEAISILYNTSKYKMNLYSEDWEFEVFFLSNMKKLNENKEIFFDACKKSDGIIVFYNPETQEDFNNAADMCINLRKSLPDLEIILTTGFEYNKAPANLELERYLELEKLEKNYQINNYDDHESIISEILINVLKRKKKLDKDTNFLISQLKEMQDQIEDQKAGPYKLREIKEFIISREKTKRTVPLEPHMTSQKDLLFISYSHKDKEPWLERLQVHLKPLEKEGIIQRWDDTLIRPGKNWMNEIKSALNSAKIGIFLVSADFLASDFISKEELPPLLAAADKRGTTILVVILGHCGISKTEGLKDLQYINPPSRPLVDLTKGEQQAVFEKVADEVRELLSKDF